jgi:hypothetical protein
MQLANDVETTQDSFQLMEVESLLGGCIKFRSPGMWRKGTLYARGKEY